MTSVTPQLIFKTISLIPELHLSIYTHCFTAVLNKEIYFQFREHDTTIKCKTKSPTVFYHIVSNKSNNGKNYKRTLIILVIIN